MKVKILFMVAAVCLLSSPFAWPAKTVYEDVAGLIEDNRLDEAETVLTLAVAADDKDVLALSLLGETYRRKGDRGKALKFLKRSSSINPGYPQTYLYLGKLYFTMREFDRSKKEFDRFREFVRPLITGKKPDPAYLTGLHNISHIYLDLKMYSECYDVLTEILEFSPGDQVATYNMGIYYYLYERNRPRAYEYFKRAVSIDPASGISAKAKYAIEYMRINPDPRVEPDFSFIDQEFRD